GRADIRVVLGGDSEVYVLSKSDGMIRKLVADVTPPAAVTDLAAGAVTATGIALSWTAPGADGNTGTAASYDLRYSTAGPISEATWAVATQVTGEPAPLVAGSTQAFTVTGLDCGTRYYFALKTSDEAPPPPSPIHRVKVRRPVRIPPCRQMCR